LRRRSGLQWWRRCTGEEEEGLGGGRPLMALKLGGVWCGGGGRGRGKGEAARGSAWRLHDVVVEAEGRGAAGCGGTAGGRRDQGRKRAGGRG
jgi:hypothetical protein